MAAAILVFSTFVVHIKYDMTCQHFHLHNILGTSLQNTVSHKMCTDIPIFSPYYVVKFNLDTVWQCAPVESCSSYEQKIGGKP